MKDFEAIKFVKWAGGKGQLLSQLTPLFPNKFNKYIEPFVGSGAVLFYVLQKFPEKEAIISDINNELITTYKIVQNRLDELIIILKKHQKNHNKDYYYKIRSINPNTLSDVEKAGRFIYLNKTCFNGLYRVNSKGGFNVPIGSYKNPNILQEKKLRFISKLLKNVKILNKSFETVLNYAKKGDFIYFDPPYYPLNGNSFTTYQSSEFLDAEHKKLSEVFNSLSKKGCFCMESNSYTEFIKELYIPYTLKTVTATRLINCRSEGRGIINEIVIINY